MSQRIVIPLAAVVLASGIGTARSAEEPQLVANGKRATVLVMAEGRRGLGTAFCVHKAGYFVTSQHVVDRAGEQISLIVRPGEPEQQILPARVVRTDQDNDVALLQAEGNVLPSPLKLGSDENLSETDQVTIFGYPFGAALAIEKSSYPEITVAVGRISALRRLKGKLETIQLDATLNPGNSGGPVVDGSGRVIGLVQARVRGTGIGMVVPVSRVHRLLRQPHVAFEPPVIAYSSRHDPVEIVVGVLDFEGDGTGFNVSLEWSDPAGEPQRTALKPVGVGTYAGTIVPVPHGEEPQQLLLTAEFLSGLIQCRIEDADLLLDVHKLRLRDIREIIRTNSRFTVETVDGRRFAGGELKGFPQSAHFGGYRTAIDFLSARSIRLSELGTGTTTKCTVVIERDGEVIARAEGHLVIRAPEGQDVIPGSFYEFSEQSTWPAFLKATDAALYGKDGLYVKRNQYVRTKSGDYFSRDFTFEVEIELDAGDGVALVGIGEAAGDQYGRPENCVYLGIPAPDFGEGRVVLSKHFSGSGTEIGRIRKPGTHLIRIQKRGDVVTFQVDVDSDGASPDDLKQSIPLLRGFAPFLHEKNTYLFISQQGPEMPGHVTFTRMRLLQDESAR